MKIRNRLTLNFTITVAIIFFIVLSSIYYFASLYRKIDFYEHVKERAFVAATIYLEADEMAKQAYEKFKLKYRETLPDEIIQVYDKNNKHAFISANNAVTFPDNKIDEIRKEKELSYTIGDRQVVGIYYNDNQGDFVIIASAVDESGYDKVRNLGFIIILAYLLSLVIIFFTGRFLSKKALEPINEVVNKVRKITASNLHLRVPEGNGTDEIATLAITFNNMLERLELAFEMQKTFVSNSSHELRTPLTSIIGNIEVVLSKARTTEEYKTTLTNILAEALQIDEITTDLLSLAEIEMNSTNIPKEEIRLDELIWDVKEEFKKHQPNGSEIEVNFFHMPKDSTSLVFNANRHLLVGALLNIVKNAAKFSNNHPVSISLTCTDEFNIVNIEDKGIGIHEDDLRQIFVPFYRASNAREFQGHGLGLSLAEKVFKMYGASVKVVSRIGEGSIFIINFPTGKF